jgi:hypothetical protein
LGFQVFVGSCAFLLAALGTWLKPLSAIQNGPKRSALILIGLYLLILSGPLLNVFYVRCAPLAVMGLIVLAGIGLASLLENAIVWRRAGWLVFGLAVGLALTTNLVAWVVYPRVLPRVKQFVKEREPTNVSLDAAPALRVFQAENLPAEISFQNPETALACASLVGLSVLLLWPLLRKRTPVWMTLLVLNLLPVLSFCYRYVPRQNIALWHRLLAGGLQQQKVMTELKGTVYRLSEIAPGMHEMVIPGALGHLYRVRTLHGHSSLPPPNIYKLTRGSPDQWGVKAADWVYESKARNQAAGVFATNGAPGLARFQWKGQLPRRFQVEEQALTRIRVKFETGPAGFLLWTDSWYPGWQAAADGRRLAVQKIEPCFSQIEIPADIAILDLRYQPRYLQQARWLQLIGILTLGIVGVRPMTGSRKNRVLPRQSVFQRD